MHKKTAPKLNSLKQQYWLITLWVDNFHWAQLRGSWAGLTRIIYVLAVKWQRAGAGWFQMASLTRGILSLGGRATDPQHLAGSPARLHVVAGF